MHDIGCKVILSWQQPTITVDAANFTGKWQSGLQTLFYGCFHRMQFLKWTGTVWDNAADLTTVLWDENDNYIYNYSEKIGIGTNKPTQKLTIVDGSTKLLYEHTEFLQRDIQLPSVYC